jgi:hypothetical protein
MQQMAELQFLEECSEMEIRCQDYMVKTIPSDSAECL